MHILLSKLQRGSTSSRNLFEEYSKKIGPEPDMTGFVIKPF